MPSKIQVLRDAVSSHYADIASPSVAASEPGFGESALAIAATVIAVLVVGFIAVLMGIA